MIESGHRCGRLALFGPVPVAQAATCPPPGEPFHCFSWAREDDDTLYTGVKNRHYVLGLINSSPSPVYQFMWLNFQTFGDFVEMGTEYSNGNRYTYGFQRKNGVDSWLYRVAGAAVGTHSFKIDRDDTNFVKYNLYLDGIDINSPGSALYSSGVMLTVGLESWNSSIVVDPYSSFGLLYGRNGGLFVNWAGKDESNSDEAPMCGRWENATEWVAGEHTSCV